MVAEIVKPLAPVFDVIIGGALLPIEANSHIVSITVDESLDLPSMFTLELGASDNLKDENAWVDDERLFSVGNIVEVKMGYDDDPATLIIGEITSLEPEFNCDSPPRLIVRGYDRLHRLQRGRKTRTFVQKKDSDIASQIASEAGLNSQVIDSDVMHEYVIQANQSDFQFLQSRARRIRFEVAVEDKTLFFRPASNDAAEVLTMTMSDHLLEFYPRLSSARQVSELDVRGWSLKDKKELLGQARTGDEISIMGGQESGPQLTERAFGAAVTAASEQPVATQAEADQIAKAQFNRSALALIEGEGVCLGRTDVRAGKVVKIEGIGNRFSGHYYVTAAVHRFDNDGYRIHFTVRRNAS
ncbi:MAG TPA: contractile injection system protein, VgrG/Pvc8 family [Blastocatellia bacterium]|nr:contractile injection system protein, VgrG/Pvc8 family [Blastocatellia bacterium]